MSTARSSAAARSQIHKVLGESSSLVAKRVEEASKPAKEQPGLTGAARLASDDGPGGETLRVARRKG